MRVVYSEHERRLIMGIKIGDKVEWFHTSKRGRVRSSSLRRGIVESANGDVATVRYGKKTLCEVVLEDLQPGEAQRMMGAVVEALR